ncbi:TPA: site-specific DNA-methyltransferase, partial [Staphylococcus pseudintermedius]|nr:site-specific DNA-methyltransferase [Staphylococcus pseudintermedius]
MNNLKYEKGDISIFQGDMADVLDTFDEEMVDMIFADPPYFLSSGGITCSGGKMVSVDKGVWDK